VPCRSSTMLLKGADGFLHAGYIWAQNTGRGLITNIEVVLNYPPQHYEIWPQREYQVETNPMGGW
jgi:hypothetical protein